MPVGYHINPDEGLITVRADGQVAIDELAVLGHSLLDDTGYDRALPQLLDFRGMRPRPRGDLEALREFVHGEYRSRIGSDIAVVIDDHLESQHCADIFLLTCAIHEAELFADYDQALKWLMRRSFVPAATGAPGAPALAEQEDSSGKGAHGAPE